jgi:NADPH:quinone reductase-like Zn-dependent oxidoreductase
LTKNVDALAIDGRLFIIGMQGGPKGELNLATVLAKRLTVAGILYFLDLGVFVLGTIVRDLNIWFWDFLATSCESVYNMI